MEINKTDFEKEENENPDLLSSDNNIKIYLNDIGRVNLLTTEEERELAIRMSSGDDQAKKILIESNLRLVVNIAKKYRNSGLPLSDLIQEGNIGLIKAIERFDVNLGYKLSTYATFWIEQAIRIAIMNNSKNIRVPKYVYEILAKYNKVALSLQNKLGRTPTNEEIADYLDIDVSEIEKFDIEHTTTISLNKTVDELESTELENFVSIDENSTEDIALSNDLQEKLNVIYGKYLKEREREILILKRGYNYSTKEILKKYNISRQRVHEIEQRALNILRTKKDIKDLAIYMEDPDQSLQNLENLYKDYQVKQEERKKRVKEARLRKQIQTK